MASFSMPLTILLSRPIMLFLSRRFISGDSNLHTDLIEPVDDKAKEKNEEFELEDAKIVVFAQEFNNTFCLADVINWQSRVKFNSDEIGLL